MRHVVFRPRIPRMTKPASTAGMQELLNLACQKIQENNGEAALALLRKIPPASRSTEASITLADALRMAERYKEAKALYIQCAQKGDTLSPVLWRRVAECCYACRELDEAILYARFALGLNPDDGEAHYLVGRLLFTSTLYNPGCGHAHFLLEHANHDDPLVLAENLFRFSQMPSEAYQVVKRRAEISPDPSCFLGLLICGAQGICNWPEAERYADELEKNYYEKGIFHIAREIPLYNIARTKNEAVNLAVARASMEEINALVPLFDGAYSPKPKIRVGFLSADFAAHPVITLIIGMLENLNPEKFEIYAYDDGMKEAGEQYSRFKKIVTKQIDVREKPDEEVARLVHDDKVDILIDLMGITTKNRIGALALRPCPVTATFLGFPGSTGVSAVDYIITDRIITPDSSKPHYAEKLCRLPEAFMPQDDKRFLAANPVCREDVGLPENTVVFCSFNRSFKLNRESVELWMRILARVPNSVLWQKADEEQMMRVFQECAQAHGVAPERIIFAGNTANIPLHLTRASLADIALDTLIYNGHTITADLLWAGVPVLTVTGEHFASRVSTSLLFHVGLAECACRSVQEMEDMAVALALNPARLALLKKRLAENKKQFPLFNTKRYTRHFENALLAMLERAKQGLKPDHMDIPPVSVFEENTPPFWMPSAKDPVFPPAILQENIGTLDGKAYTDTAQDLNLQKNSWQIHFGTCPLCHAIPPAQGHPLNFEGTPGWDARLPGRQVWIQCEKCGHLHALAFWNSKAKTHIFSQLPPQILSADTYTEKRPEMITLVAKTAALLPKLYQRDTIWLDIGCGDGALALTAADSNFRVTALDIREESASALREIGLSASACDYMTASFTGEAHIFSFCGTLEEIPYPHLALTKAYYALPENGLVLVGFDNRQTFAWNLKGQFSSANPLTRQIMRLHYFTLPSMCNLLKQCGFTPLLPTVQGNSPGYVYLFARKSKKTSPARIHHEGRQPA